MLKAEKSCIESQFINQWANKIHLSILTNHVHDSLAFALLANGIFALRKKTINEIQQSMSNSIGQYFENGMLCYHEHALSN